MTKGNYWFGMSLFTFAVLIGIAANIGAAIA